MKSILLFSFSALLILSSFAEYKKFQRSRLEELQCYYCPPGLPNRCFFVSEKCTRAEDEKCQITTVYRGNAIHYVSRTCTDPAQREKCGTTIRDPDFDMTTITTCCSEFLCNRIPATLP